MRPTSHPLPAGEAPRLTPAKPKPEPRAGVKTTRCRGGLYGKNAGGKGGQRRRQSPGLHPCTQWALNKHPGVARKGQKEELSRSQVSRSGLC